MSKLIVKNNQNIEAKDHAIYFDYMFGKNGVMNKGNRLDMTVQSSNLVKLKDGIVVVQGRPFLIYPNEVVDVSIESGTQNMKRNDLIVAEFSKTSDADVFSFKAIKGTPNASNPVDPQLVQQDTLSSGTVFQLPLFRIRLNGINVESTDDLRIFIPSMNDTVKALSYEGGILTVEIPDNISYKTMNELDDENDKETLEEPPLTTLEEPPIMTLEEPIIREKGRRNNGDKNSTSNY